MKILKSSKLEKLFGEELKYGACHCHTYNSMDDAVTTEKEVCEVSKALGAKAAFITDHGTAMGWDEFDEAAKKAGIKAIFGVEAYYLDDVTDMKSHLIIYAKNNTGLKQINKAMARGTIIQDGRMCFTDETLKCFKGGNVIATSACIQGPLGSIVLFNNRIEEKIQKLQKEIESFSDSVALYELTKEQYEEANKAFLKSRSELSEVKAAAKKSFTGKQKQLDGMKKKLEKASLAFDKYLEDGKDASAKSVKVALAQLEVSVESPDEFQDGLDTATQKVNQRAAQLKSEISASKLAAGSIEQKNAEFENVKKAKTELKASLDSLEKVISKVESRQEKIRDLREQKLSKEQSQGLFEKRLKTMLDVFGSNFYIEVQNHGLAQEAIIYPWLAKVAKKRGIPLIAANDIHMATNSKSDITKRQIRRSCRFSKWEPITDDFSEYYIKNDKELAMALYQILPEDIVIEAMNNVSKLVEQCNATIDKESHAPKAKLDSNSESVKEAIIRIARSNIDKKYGNTWSKEHEERFNYEINIIDSMGFSDYFYITWDILNVARMIGGLSYEKLDDLKANMNNMDMDSLMNYLNEYNTEPNLSVGLGRGSGAGSIVCYLLGITNIDPLKYHLLFERFLNPERISMPDIDSDFRTDIKDVLTVYLKKKYGERAIAQILTKSMLQGKSAIDKVVMILGSRDGIDYRYIADKLKKKTGVDFDNKSMEENREALLRGCDSDIEKEIVETAILMDGNLDHTGLHAAGVIISDNDDLSEYIPVAWDQGFETWKTQCDMVRCESKHGLLKMDLLLLKTLDIITYAMRLIKTNHPNDSFDIENLPMEEEVFKNIYGKGDTKSVFQFESSGMIKFLRQMQPTRIEDIIAANAMYRPGPMDSIPDYVAAKNSGKINYDCKELEPILKDTYGVIIYQEQVMRIVRDLAGYSLGRSDLVRRAMAKKHMDELVAERKNFVYGNKDEGIHGCVAIGINENVANKIFDKMIAFASYAFNESHAAAYSVTSYLTAWLKYHYPCEFYCAALNFTGAQKEIPSIVADAKLHNIEVLQPDVNKSEANFSTENGNVRFGLKFLANAKTRANAVVESREGGYKSFADFVKAKPGKAIIEACILSGACDLFIGNNPNRRSELMAAYDEMSTLYDSLSNAANKLDKAEGDTAKKKAQDAYDLAYEKWETYKLPSVEPFTLIDRLTYEQKVTSVYFSGNPMDGFEISDSYKTIASLNNGDSGWVAAAISDDKVLKTKKGALPMMSGKLTDSSGTINFIIFPKAYAKICDKLQTVMGFRGTLNQGNDEEPQFVVEDVKVLPPKSKKIVIWFDDFQKTKQLLKENSVGKDIGLEAWLVGKNSKMYRSGAYITEEFAKTLHYMII